MKQLIQIFISLILITPLMLATSIGIPPADEIIDRADVIILGHFEDARTSQFTITEILKNTKFENIKIDTPIEVYSPYPEMSFSLSSFIKKLNKEETILLGNWNEKRNALNANFINCSFWPHGMLPERLPAVTLSELRDYIKDSTRKKVDGVSNQNNTASKTTTNVATTALQSENTIKDILPKDTSNSSSITPYEATSFAATETGERSFLFLLYSLAVTILLFALYLTYRFIKK